MTKLPPNSPLRLLEDLELRTLTAEQAVAEISEGPDDLPQLSTEGPN